MAEAESSSSSSSPIPAPEEQNYSLKEEVVHLDQLLVDTQTVVEDTVARYENLTDQVESLLMQQSEDSDEEELLENGVEHGKEQREHLEEELAKYRNQVSAYQTMQREQSKIIDDMQSRIEEYRSRCARLEAAIADVSAPLDLSKNDSEFHDDEADVDTLRLKLEQEINRCQRLNQINALYREQLEATTEANKALTADIDQLSKECKNTQMELVERQSSWQREEQSFTVYLTREHHHLLSLWTHIRYCRSQFVKMKQATENDLSTIRSYMQNTSQQIEHSCTQLTMCAPSMQQSDNTELIQEIIRKNHEIFVLKQGFSSEKRDLTKKLQDSDSLIAKGKLLLEEKCKMIESLNKAIEAMKISEHEESSRIAGSRSICQNSSSTNRCCSAIKEIGQIVLDDADHRSWTGVRSSSLTSIRKALLSSTPHSLNNICENTIFLESTVNGVQTALRKRCLQIEESDLKLTALKERCSTQQKVIETLTSDKKDLNQLTAKLSSQLESLQNEMTEVVNDRQKMQSSFKESGSQKYFLEQTRKSQNDLIEKIGSENDRLYQKQNNLYELIEQLQQKQDQLTVSEQSLTMELSVCNKKLSLVQDNMKETEKKYQDSQRKLEKISMDKELLEQEKEEFKNSLDKYEKEHAKLDGDILLLKKEADTLQTSIDSLKNANAAHTHDKKDLEETISEANAKCDSLNAKLLKEKSGFEKDKQELKEKYEQMQQRSLELEAEMEILKKSLSQVESNREELEQAQQIVVQRNNGLISQVTKLSHQKDLLEKELEQARQEMELQAENSEIVLHEREILAREKAELTVRVTAAEKEISELAETISALRKEKEQLERDIFTQQQANSNFKIENSRLEEKGTDINTQLEHLQVQLSEVKHQKEMDFESMARQKDSLNHKFQQMEQEYDFTLKNLRQEHKSEMDAFIEEKQSQREHLVAVHEEFTKQLQEEIDNLIEKHAEEVSSLKKQMIFHEQEIEKRLIKSMDEKSSYEKKLESEKSSLEQVVEDLKKKIEETEVQHVNNETETAISANSYHSLLQDKECELSRMKEELKNLRFNKEDVVGSLESEIEDLKQQKVTAIEDITRVTVELDSILLQKKTLEGKLEKTSNNLEDEKQKRDELEQEVVVLQQKLSNEKKQVELVRISQEDLKARLRKNQLENNDLKHAFQMSRQRIQSLEASSAQFADDSKDMKDTMRELEASRMEARREIQSLRRSLIVSEATNQSQGNELSEMQFLMARADEIETELKNEIFCLKQKVMEAEASKEATLKEMSNLLRKLQDVEQKLKLKQEEHNLSLQEALSGETSYTEHRLGLEKSLVTVKEELQQMRLKLNVSEGRAAAFERQMSKLEGGKRELENKLHVLHLSLRSFLGIGADSGFRGSSTRLWMSPFSSRRESPSKFAEFSNSSALESTPFHDHHPTSSSTPIRPEIVLSVADLDIDLIRAALQDFTQRLSTAERERDDLRSDLSKAQKEVNDANNRLKVHEEKLRKAERETEIIIRDKKELEDQLTVKKSNVSQLEDAVQDLEEEKRKLCDKSNRLLQESSSSEIEKNALQVKLSELYQNESSLKKVQMQMREDRDNAESRAVKAELLCNEMESERNVIEEILSRKSSELENLHDHIDDLKTSLHTSETKTCSLQMSVDHLNAIIEKYKNKEAILHQKLESLEMSLTDATLAAQQLNKDLQQLRREHGSCEHEKSFFRNEAEAQRSTANQLKAKNEGLKTKVGDLIEATRNYELHKAELEGQLLGYKNVVSYNEESEKTSNEKTYALEKEKYLLEDQLSRLKNNFSKNEELRLLAEKQKHKFSKENSLLRKALDKAERERLKTEEVASRSVFERAALGKSLSKMEMENQQLMQKIQNLQVQLVELEHRHVERIKDLDKKQKFEMQLELERLRSTQKHMEKLLSTKEKSYHQKVVGLEQQIDTLQEHLKQAHSPWKVKTPSRSVSVSFLNDIFNDSLQKSSDNDGEPAKRINTSSSPIAGEHSPSSNRLPSTSQVRRRIDKNFPS